RSAVSDTDQYSHAIAANPGRCRGERRASGGADLRFAPWPRVHPHGDEIVVAELEGSTDRTCGRSQPGGVPMPAGLSASAFSPTEENGVCHLFGSLASLLAC